MEPLPPAYESHDMPPDYVGGLPISAPGAQSETNPNLKLSSRTDKKRMEDEPPTADECIVHLKLLAAIADLRDEVSTTDGLFGLSDGLIDHFSSEDDKYRAAAIIREKRWQIYVTRAVDRFETWFNSCITTDGGNGLFNGTVTVDDIENGENYRKITDWDTAIVLTIDTLPPLDVLMVWHSYMLNPRIYLEDCIRLGRMSFWVTGMPWEAIDAALDTDDLNFLPGDDAKEYFERMAGIPWDNLLDSPAKLIKCPSCLTAIEAELESREWKLDALETPFEHSDGYADTGFRKICPTCSLVITHSTLQVAQFRQDMARLQLYQTPMPGTLLSLNGLPENTKHKGHENMQLPNKIIPKVLHNNLLDRTDFYHNPAATIETIRDYFEFAFKKERHLFDPEKMPSLPQTRQEKIAFRRLLSRYWGNSSVFGLDLVGAVIRQGTFITKMDTIDWLHSPTLQATMEHLLNRYTVFIHIISQHRKLAVPTLDIDLGWHTHQLAPQSYFRYSLHKTRDRFIDHDDKVTEDQLTMAFEWTSKKYMEYTNGEPYSECICWYCEATREANYGPAMKMYLRSRAKKLAEALHAERGNGQNPTGANPTGANPHISTHNAVPVAKMQEPWMVDSKHHGVRQRLMDYHQKAMRRAEKRERAREKKEMPDKGKERQQRSGMQDTEQSSEDVAEKSMWQQPQQEPQQQQKQQQLPASASASESTSSLSLSVHSPAKDRRYGYYPIIWGYPIFIPFYAPYATDPSITPAIYPTNPSCMSTDVHGAANCIPGTCVAEVAAGVCGGDGGVGAFGAGGVAGDGGGGGEVGSCGGGGGG
ncbi:hypothetical protein EMPG_17472 [Blastomyces silverae]|uniref:Uncharacterized protein n=1 Tax=Blastomyces silverae TaxID=2060906 RepID=A0A0H1B6H2_9EURO|nr:hypothetical protein EMPG_17472 [Blastomyces silverae]